MKTKLYKIQFQFIETNMSSEIIISKKEFDKQLAFLREQIAKTADYECPVEEMQAFETDRICYTEKTYVFSSGCATTYLTESICKTGYKFKV